MTFWRAYFFNLSYEEEEEATSLCFVMINNESNECFPMTVCIFAGYIADNNPLPDYYTIVKGS